MAPLNIRKLVANMPSTFSNILFIYEYAGISRNCDIDYLPLLIPKHKLDAKNLPYNMVHNIPNVS